MKKHLLLATALGVAISGTIINATVWVKNNTDNTIWCRSLVGDNFNNSVGDESLTQGKRMGFNLGSLNFPDKTVKVCCSTSSAYNCDLSSITLTMNDSNSGTTYVWNGKSFNKQ